MAILNSIMAALQSAGADVLPADTLGALQQAAGTAAAATQEMSVWELTLKGGIIMIPLAILSVISIYILIERFLAIKTAAKEDKTFMRRIKDYIHEGEIESAVNLCKKTDTPYSRLIMKGMHWARVSTGWPPRLPVRLCSGSWALLRVWCVHSSPWPAQGTMPT